MSRTVLADVNGFTPCIDTLIEQHGLITAAVFGRMWRFCQGDYGVCVAKQELIADYLGLNRQTVLRHIKILVENGYLEDRTPGLRNRPHTYADTGKVSLLLKLTAGVTLSDSGVKQSDSDGNSKLHEDSIKKQIKKQKRDIPPKGQKAKGFTPYKQKPKYSLAADQGRDVSQEWTDLVNANRSA